MQLFKRTKPQHVCATIHTHIHTFMKKSTFMFIVALKLLNSGTVDFEFYLVYQGKLLNISLLQFSHLQTMNNKLL